MTIYKWNDSEWGQNFTQRRESEREDNSPLSIYIKGRISQLRQHSHPTFITIDRPQTPHITGSAREHPYYIHVSKMQIAHTPQGTPTRDEI